MPRLYYLLPNKSDPNKISKERYQKVMTSLVTHVYMQINLAMIASLLCAGILVIGLYGFQKNNTRLWIWAAFFLIITISRVVLSSLYKLEKFPEKKIRLWSNLYILGSGLAGCSWGSVGIFIFPYVSATQQTLIILMLAGITAGAVPLSAAVPRAASAFLIFSVFPFIISIGLLNTRSYYLFDLALAFYLLYTIILTIKAYQLIKNSIILNFENDILVNNLEISNKKLEQAATHDPLTQAANRMLFKKTLEQKINDAKNNKKKIAIFYIDLDNFKLANDVYGHQAGDLILITVIERLKDFFHNDDNIARLGGDEIAVIVENVNSRDEIEETARKICVLIACPIRMNEINLQISASIGISIYPYDGSDEENLLRRSDESMYHAKKRGGNNFYLNKERVE